MADGQPQAKTNASFVVSIMTELVGLDLAGNPWPQSLETTTVSYMDTVTNDHDTNSHDGKDNESTIDTVVTQQSFNLDRTSDRGSPTSVVTHFTASFEPEKDHPKEMCKVVDQSPACDTRQNNHGPTPNDILPAFERPKPTKEATTPPHTSPPLVVSLRQQIATLQTQLDTARRDHKAMQVDLEADRHQFRAAIQRVAARRDTFKAQYQQQVAVNHALHEAVAVAGKATRQAQAVAERTQHLLQLYRKLSKLTGYQQLGKEIRAAEAALEGGGRK